MSLQGVLWSGRPDMSVVRASQRVAYHAQEQRTVAGSHTGCLDTPGKALAGEEIYALFSVRPAPEVVKGLKDNRFDKIFQTDGFFSVHNYPPYWNTAGRLMSIK
jgi:hypothetical protein